MLCEKPCGLTTAETRAIAALPTRLQVAYWRRFVPALRTLRERIAAGELGEVAIVRCAQWDESPPSRAFRDPASSGGIVVDMGVHEFDQMRWLTGQEVGARHGCRGGHRASSTSRATPSRSSSRVALSGGRGRQRLARPALRARRDRFASRCSAPTARCRSTSSRRPTGDETIAAALRAQAEDFARAGGEGATVADALAALDAAERARASL